MQNLNLNFFPKDLCKIKRNKIKIKNTLIEIFKKH